MAGAGGTALSEDSEMVEVEVEDESPSTRYSIDGTRIQVLTKSVTQNIG